MLHTNTPSTAAAGLQVGPGHTLECDFYPSSSSGGSGDGSDEAGGGGTEGEGMLAATKRAGSGATGGSGWEDQEDEDAFLDCLLQVCGWVGGGDLGLWCLLVLL